MHSKYNPIKARVQQKNLDFSTKSESWTEKNLQTLENHAAHKGEKCKTKRKSVAAEKENRADFQTIARTANLRFCASGAKRYNH
jgi:hypothetical protein